MIFNTNARLWNGPQEAYFRDRLIQPIEQEGPTCLRTVLAMLSGAQPEHFEGVVNTQDPVSWSEALKPYSIKLAYVPTDNRKVRFYLPELLELNDLFTISYFIPTDPADVLRDPREDGWVCSSHVIILHGREIIDPARGDRVPALQHRCGERFTKRIFRVLPVAHPRGL